MNISKISYVLIAVVMIGLIACTTPVKVNPKEPGKIYDLFEEDALQYTDITSKDISVRGIVLGDSAEKVFEAFGEPDETDRSAVKVVTYEYGKSLGLDYTGLYVVTYENQVSSIMIMRAANDFLTGESKIDHDLRSIYDTFGIPDIQEDLPQARRFTYAQKGFEVYHKRKQMLSLGLIEPFAYDNPHVVDDAAESETE